MSRATPRRIGAFVTLWMLAATGAAPGDADDALRRLASAAGQRAPLYRVGLDSEHRLSVSANGRFRIVDPETGSPVWHGRFDGEVAVVAEGGPREGVPSVYRVQVGAYSDETRAEAERARLAERYGVPGILRYIPDRGSWRVRLGQGRDRDALASLLTRLREDGLEGVWIVEEPAETPDSITLRLVDEDYESHLTGLTRLAVVPEGRSTLRVEDTTYRGVIELRVSPFGTVRAINWIQLETYLLGVVPAELGPEVWPQLEALKAQAVAARTYAWRHRGQFDDEGFDLCATPRCQVYKGAGAEHPLSDRAVLETRGEVLTYEGRPISALYTATCGGHTEDGGEIFPEERAPYLTGVPCRAEERALEDMKVRLDGRRLAPLIAEDDTDVTRDLALLRAVGVVSESEASGGWLEPVSPEGLRGWTRRLAALAGRPAPRSSLSPLPDLGSTAEQLVRDLGWAERADVLVEEADLPALLRDAEAESLSAAQRRALGYLALAEALRPFPDGRFHVDRPPSRARLLRALTRIGETYEAFGIRQATVAGRSKQGLRVSVGKGEYRLAFAERPWLFVWTGGRAAPTESLDLWPGDRVRYRRDPAGRIDFLELIPPVKGTSDDRSAKVYSWEVRQERRRLEQTINRRVAVGRLKDLRVVRRGRSGRVVELEVVGSNSRTVVRGFDIRRLLQLRESLAVIEIQREASGAIDAVVFAGKGWGHGVGLCQVGAYGMALRGAKYAEILGHYYRGTRLRRLPAK